MKNYGYYFGFFSTTSAWDELKMKLKTCFKEAKMSKHSLIISQTLTWYVLTYYGFTATAAATTDHLCVCDNWKSFYLNLFKFAMNVHGP